MTRLNEFKNVLKEIDNNYQIIDIDFLFGVDYIDLYNLYFTERKSYLYIKEKLLNHYSSFYKDKYGVNNDFTLFLSNTITTGGLLSNYYLDSKDLINQEKWIKDNFSLFELLLNDEEISLDNKILINGFLSEEFNHISKKLTLNEYQELGNFKNVIFNLLNRKDIYSLNIFKNDINNFILGENKRNKDYIIGLIINRLLSIREKGKI